MFENVSYFFNKLLGPDKSILTVWQMANRAFIVYILGIILLRINTRFMNVRTVYNFFLYILLGSILASVIMGSTDFFHSLGIIIVIMGMNILTNVISFYSPVVEKILKGSPIVLIENGKINWPGMRETWITKDELMEALHDVGLEDISLVKKATFENSGRITVIKK